VIDATKEPAPRGAGSLNQLVGESVDRAVVRTLGRWMGCAALECPCKDERECIYVAIGKHRVAEVRPSITHQVGALEQVRRVSQTERVADLVKRDPTEILGGVGVSAEAWREIGTHNDIRALVGTADRVATEDHAARGRYVVDDDVRGLSLLPRYVRERDPS
jgi:hypothetical protein